MYAVVEWDLISPLACEGMIGVIRGNDGVETAFDKASRGQKDGTIFEGLDCETLAGRSRKL